MRFEWVSMGETCNEKILLNKWGILDPRFNISCSVSYMYMDASIDEKCQLKVG